MAAVSNVALGMQVMPNCIVMNKGTLLRRLLACGLLLSAPVVSGISIRGGIDRWEAAPVSGADAAELASDQAEHGTNNALAAVGTAAGELGDTGRLVETEHKALSAHLQKKSQALLPESLSDDDGTTNYIVASFPEFRVVNYVRLPDLVWRPLVVTGIASPKHVVIDNDRNRLYIVDAGVAKILWYQLIVLPDKTLISDGRQHVAVQAVACRNLALDLEGNLWFSAASTPVPPTPSTDAIWKQPIMAIDQGAASGMPIDPLPQWTKAHTGSMPSALVLDAFGLYYGNDGDGKNKGSLVKASQSVPVANPSSGLTPLADNVDTTYSVAVTPTAMFYGSDDAIYGVLKNKVGGSCGATGDLCKVITDLVKKPTAMLWDGDGTVYVADNGAGAIYSFASGSVSPHALDKIIDAGEIFGMDILKFVKEDGKNSASSVVPTAMLAALLLLVVGR
jgi:hypothetical protein